MKKLILLLLLIPLVSFGQDFRVQSKSANVKDGKSWGGWSSNVMKIDFYLSSKKIKWINNGKIVAEFSNLNIISKDENLDGSDDQIWKLEDDDGRSLFMKLNIKNDDVTVTFEFDSSYSIAFQGGFVKT